MKNQKCIELPKKDKLQRNTKYFRSRTSQLVFLQARMNSVNHPTLIEISVKLMILNWHNHLKLEICEVGLLSLFEYISLDKSKKIFLQIEFQIKLCL